jgi:hypothetical protein
MPRRLSVRLLHGIESLEFDARISRAELPVHCADSLVAMILPTLNLLTEFLDGHNIASQTLPCQYNQFDLGNIEPARMLGGVSWPRGAFQGVWRLSSGPGGERQGCPKQKGADGGQVEVRLVQIDLMARMREIQQGRVGQGRLVLPGDCPLDIVTGSGQNQRRGVVRGKPRARIDVSMPVLGIGGGKDVVVEAIALHLPFGQVRRVTNVSLGDALDERIKERIRFPIRHQGMRGFRIDQSEQIPGDETRRI